MAKGKHAPRVESCPRDRDRVLSNEHLIKDSMANLDSHQETIFAAASAWYPDRTYEYDICLFERTFTDGKFRVLLCMHKADIFLAHSDLVETRDEAYATLLSRFNHYHVDWRR